MEEPAIYEDPCFALREHHDSLSKVSEAQSKKKAKKAEVISYYLTPEPEIPPARSQSVSQPKASRPSQMKRSKEERDEELTYYEVTAPEPETLPARPQLTSQRKASRPSQMIKKDEEHLTYYEATPEVERRPLRSSSRPNQSPINAKTETVQDLKKDRTLLITVLCILGIAIFITLVALILSLWSAFTPGPASTSPAAGTNRTTGGVVQQNQISNQDCSTCSNLNDILTSLDALSQQLSSLDQETSQRINTLDQQSNQRFLTLDQLNERFVSSDQLNGMLISSSQLQEVRNNISALETTIRNISNSLQLGLPTACTSNNSIIRQIPDCGSGDWLRVAYINMADSSQQCPSAWREYTSPRRSCGRPVTSSGGCPSTSFETCGLTYRRVCGKVIGYQYGSPDAYSVVDIPNHPPITSPSDNYVDGVSVTHGSPTRTHIWTFAVGHSPNSDDLQACPCDNPNAFGSPSFVGNNYFCESGPTNEATVPGQFYTNNRLWDGTGCRSGSTCCTFNSPPWFTVELPSSTSDDIEVRICGDEGTDNEDAPIELLELYVQ